ncbi:MAG: DUF1611 domain-containing protein [Actinomycetota bacterium]|nr:DUF1611 domain-containing protein [Actinomycetota bacterium]
MSAPMLDVVTIPLSADRLRRAKAAYTTRHVDLAPAAAVATGGTPEVGDLVLAGVQEVGQHLRIEGRDGRRAHMFPGDEVVVAYGNRYAPDQFEAVVPDDLGPCHLVAAGGIAARVLSAHGRMSEATSLLPVGLLVDSDGRRLNLRSGAVPTPETVWRADRPVTVAVLGASMNAGKTTSAASLVRGLRAAGVRVGAAKVTGTGAGGDVWVLQDSGAYPVYDFTCAGVPSTYRVGAQEVRRIFTDLTDRLAGDGCEAVVIEVADGVYQEETSELVQDDVFRDRVDALLFAASDALGACAGNDWLRIRGMAALALSGVLSASPLATREAEAATGCQVWGLERLIDADATRALYEDLLAGRRVRGADQAPDPDPVVELELARPRLSSAV